MVEKVRFHKIRDYLGRKILPHQIEAEQSAGVASLSREFADHPSRGLTPGRVASILTNAEGGNLVDQCDLGQDIEEKDAHVFAELSKRKRVLQGLEWQIVPPRNPSKKEKLQAEMTQEVFEDFDNFEDIVFDMLDAVGQGYSNHEVDWRYEQKLRIPHLTHRPARWFTVDKNDHNKLMLRNGTGLGEELWAMNWVSHVHKAKTGYITRGGLHRVLAWLFLFKNYSVRDLAEFIEIYGIPARVGTYPSGASREEKGTLLNAVTSIGHHAAGIMPEGMMIDFKEAATGAAGPFMEMIKWCEGSQSKAILGGTLTSSAENTGLGSNLGDVQNEVRHDIKESDAKQIASTLTRDLVAPFVQLNMLGADPSRCPRFEYILQEPEDIATMSEALKTLVSMDGMRIPASWAHDKMQIPIAKDEEAVLGVKEKPATEPEKDQAATAAASAARPDPDFTDNQVQQLQDATAPTIDDMLDKIKHVIDEVDSMEELQDRLVEAFNYMDIDEMAEVIQLGTSAAELAGRFDIQDGE